MKEQEAMSEPERSKAQLRRVKESFEEQVRQRTALLELLQSIAVAANQASRIEEALRVAIHRIAEYNDWDLGHAYLISDERGSEYAPTGIWHVTSHRSYERFKRATMRRRYRKGEGAVSRVLEAGESLWVDNLLIEADWARQPLEGLRAAVFLPIKIADRVVGLLEFFSRSATEPEERFERMMRNVGIQLGHVFERKMLAKRIAELADNEQRRIGHELHDGLGQRLTAITLMVAGLKQKLESKGAAESAAELVEIIRELQSAKGEVAGLIEGLIPIEVRAESFSDALRTLAERSSRIYGIDCRYEGPDSIPVPDVAFAMHVYRIAQEAVTNTVKHADANHAIIEFENDRKRDRRVLRIRDDGNGFAKSPDYSPGMGIRIMRHRADLLGGALSVRTLDEGGAVVECVFGSDV